MLNRNRPISIRPIRGDVERAYRTSVDVILRTQDRLARDVEEFERDLRRIEQTLAVLRRLDSRPPFPIISSAAAMPSGAEQPVLSAPSGCPDGHR